MNEPDERILHGAESVATVTLTLIGSTAVELRLFSRALLPRIFDRSEALEALKQFLIDRSRHRTRILLQDIDRLRRDGSQLLRLAQRLPSSCEVRVTGAEHADIAEQFLLADRSGLIRYLQADGLRAYIGSEDRDTVHRLDELFEEAWNAGQSHPDLLRLSL